MGEPLGRTVPYARDRSDFGQIHAARLRPEGHQHRKAFCSELLKNGDSSAAP
jgi:hypothetical protein